MKSVVLVFAATLSVVVLLYGQKRHFTQTFFTTKDPQAQAIVQQAVTAMGGNQAIAQYVDCQATGQLTSADGTTYPWRLYSKGLQNLRIELSTASGINVLLSIAEMVP